MDSRLILNELRRRLGRQPKQAWTAAKLVALCHPKQAAFVGDQSRRKAALCSRRAGKSFGLLVWFIVGALTDPGGLSVFICRTKGDARRILEPAVMELRQRTDMALRFFERDGQLMLELPGNHSLWLAGCKDQSEVGKFRGAGKGYRRAAVDEAQEFADDVLRKLVLGALEPALLDKKGDLAITGTPGPIPAGLFHQITTGEGGTKWPTHDWTIHDNPHIEDADAELAAYLKQYGLTEDAPVFIREWKGKWVYDASALVYPFVADKNACSEADLPTENLVWVLGVDLGSTSATAFVLGCMVAGGAHVYVTGAAKHENWIPSRIAAEIERYRKATPGLRVVIDEGGLGRGYAEEFRARYGIPCEAAEKKKKRGFQEIVAGELRSATIKIDAWACRELLDEMSILQWLPDRSEEDAARFENHACDAFLYCVRALRSGYNPTKEPPKPGSAEWHEANRQRERDAARQRGKKRNRGGFKRAALLERDDTVLPVYTNDGKQGWRDADSAPCEKSADGVRGVDPLHVGIKRSQLELGVRPQTKLVTVERIKATDREELSGGHRSRSGGASAEQGAPAQRGARASVAPDNVIRLVFAAAEFTREAA